MPRLIYGYTKHAIEHNIKTEMETGKSKKIATLNAQIIAKRAKDKMTKKRDKDKDKNKNKNKGGIHITLIRSQVVRHNPDRSFLCQLPISPSAQNIEHKIEEIFDPRGNTSTVYEDYDYWIPKTIDPLVPNENNNLHVTVYREDLPELHFLLWRNTNNTNLDDLLGDIPFVDE